MIHTALLESRSLLRLHGEDTVSFLQNLITCDVENLALGEAAFGALLTPQGKILFDFFVIKQEHGFLFDVDEDSRTDLAKRLKFYKLRADVTIEPNKGNVFGNWGKGELEGAIDPRDNSMGTRSYNEAIATNASESDWHEWRIKVGMPQSNLDYPLGEAFPHEVLMDQFGGVDFTKGCYVGQEVVSRMQHRGTTRKRIVIVTSKNEDALPPAGTEIVTEDRAIGSMGSNAGSIGLAIVRLDRMQKAISGGVSIEADKIPLSFSRPSFANYKWPQ